MRSLSAASNSSKRTLPKERPSTSFEQMLYLDSKPRLRNAKLGVLHPKLSPTVVLLLFHPLLSLDRRTRADKHRNQNRVQYYCS